MFSKETKKVLEAVLVVGVIFVILTIAVYNSLYYKPKVALVTGSIVTFCSNGILLSVSGIDIVDKDGKPVRCGGIE